MKHCIKFGLGLLFCLSGFAYNSKAQDIQVGAKLDKTTIALGDQTILRLSAQLTVGQQVSFPVLADTLSSKIQIVSVGKTDTLPDQNKPDLKLIVRQYVVTSFDAGLQTVPSFTFQSGGKSFTTDPLPLQVNSVKVDTTKAIYDIKQPLTVSYTFLDWFRDNWHLVLAGALLVLLIIFTWYYFKKIRKPKPVTEKIMPFVSADVTALEKLNILKERKLWQQDQVKLYYSELTDILREYLEKKYHINAQEQTSEETLAGLISADITDAVKNDLRKILMLADLVKFAKEKPVNTDNEQIMDDAVHFINDTRKIIEPLDTVDKDELV